MAMILYSCVLLLWVERGLSATHPEKGKIKYTNLSLAATEDGNVASFFLSVIGWDDCSVLMTPQWLDSVKVVVNLTKSGFHRYLFYIFFSECAN